ncbi:hypothetical protein GOEFS_119_00180 [Gordonia effusa NBRC 100432]|uniref:Uncharacterized protein n=1 Tax=Gordonia effusa NBRC 100432 TaxID=1077974 RepID=H0R627_9ACTN|nr:hypothetical protein [Gordonia effusa]GAB20528.1 hypothetical protein GOEFS_119_00180 [Gordonia effusa NBRC 100432]
MARKTAPADELEDDVEVIRNFTASRKFPQLIGKTPDGKRIIGGPYTLPQLIGAGSVGGVLYLIRDWWTGLGLVGSVFVVAFTVGGTVVALGRLRPGGRSPFSLLAGLGKAASAAPTASIDGRSRNRRLRAKPRVIYASGYIVTSPPPPAPPRATSLRKVA